MRLKIALERCPDSDTWVWVSLQQLGLVRGPGLCPCEVRGFVPCELMVGRGMDTSDAYLLFLKKSLKPHRETDLVHTHTQQLGCQS